MKQTTFLKYLNGYLDDDLGPLVLILPKTSGYVTTFKDPKKINVFVYMMISCWRNIKPFGLRLKACKILN